MNKLFSLNKITDIPKHLQNTPIAKLIEYHNLNSEQDEYSQAELLIGMCMDNRKKLNLPSNFAYVIRNGGANLSFVDFTVSYAIAMASIKHMSIIGHTDCGMVNLHLRKDAIIDGLVKTAGWTKEDAVNHFQTRSPIFEIKNEVEFTLKQTVDFRKRYPQILVAPMIYRVEDNKLYLIDE